MHGRKTAKTGRQPGCNGAPTHDRCLWLLMFRHGLRVSEACRLKLDQMDTESRVLHVCAATS